jgi:hypothetical protein
VTWGLGTQIRAVGPLHGVAEIFSGDPYAESSGGAVQIGFRYILSDDIQFDATVGKGVWGDPPIALWGSAGVRLVTRKLW